MNNYALYIGTALYFLDCILSDFLNRGMRKIDFQSISLHYKFVMDVGITNILLYHWLSWTNLRAILILTSHR